MYFYVKDVKDRKKWIQLWILSLATEFLMFSNCIYIPSTEICFEIYQFTTLYRFPELLIYIWKSKKKQSDKIEDRT